MSESWGESNGAPVLCAVAKLVVLATKMQSAILYVSERILAVDIEDNEVSRPSCGVCKTYEQSV